MTKLLYQRILVVLLALIVVFGGWFAADWQLRRAEATANWTDTKQVLILDAGHGGEDGGAVAPNGTVEADVNLQIALRARAIAELTGVEVVMTRDSPDIAYPDDATTIAERKKPTSTSAQTSFAKRTTLCSSASTRTATRIGSRRVRRCCTQQAPAATRSARRCMTISSHTLTRKTGASQRQFQIRST